LGNGVQKKIAKHTSFGLKDFRCPRGLGNASPKCTRYGRCRNYNEIKIKKKKRTQDFMWKPLWKNLEGEKKQNPL